VRVRNFGRNVDFQAEVLTPRDEREVLALLRAHAGRTIRAVGAAHSWSGLVRSDHFVIDLRRLDRIDVHRGGPGVATVTAGAGARIGAILKALAAHGLTLPTVGAITKQTIAGAVSTGTHGSGASSLSHYVRGVRLATHDPRTGEPALIDLDGTNPDPCLLRAARCGLGCLGVIVSVTLACVPAYDVEEVLDLPHSVLEVLAAADAYPLQQFVVIPYAWRPYAFHRRRADRRRRRSLWSRVTTRAYRAHKLLVVDVLMHLLVKGLARFASGHTIQGFYRRALPATALRGLAVTDTSERALTLRHDLFRHVEMEVFVPAAALVEALHLVQVLTDAFAGVGRLSTSIETALAARAPGALAELQRHEGRYTHHYVIPCRRVHPDETLISMTADGREAWALGFFTYAELTPAFHAYCRAVGLALVALHGARLHWGKYFPLDHAEAVAGAYPGLARFHAHCAGYDPAGTFRSAEVAATLALTGAPRSTG
jgi:FAD/FMN-containing dehydrogenase